MPVLRQITTCAEPSTVVITRRTRARDRPLDYRLELCRRHRWLAAGWIGPRAKAEAGGRRGTVLDYRPYTAIVQSHVDLWIRPLTAEVSQDHDGDIARTLHTAYERLTEHREPTGVAAALEHAARIAEAIASGTLAMAEGQTQVMAALSVAETLDTGVCGA